jgi:hypothetical protein
MQIIRRKDAIAQGLKRYFTGEPCKRGHISEKNVSDYRCLQCAAEKARERRWRDPEAARKKAREWRNKNREKINERNRQRHAANPEKHRAVAMRFYWDNWETCRQWRKDWWQANKEENQKKQREAYKQNREVFLSASRRWKAKNKDRISIYNAMKRPEREERLRKATPDWVDMDAIILKYKERDCMTQVTGLPHHVDHKVPLKGENICGLHVPWNLRVIPARDNLSKSNKWETV